MVPESGPLSLVSDRYVDGEPFTTGVEAPDRVSEDSSSEMMDLGEQLQ